MDLNILILEKENITDEVYQELIEQGMKLLKKFINDKGYFGIFDDDEKYDIVYFSIVKAISNYTSKKENKFTTYFATIIKNRLCYEIVVKNRQKNRFFNSCLSLDKEFNHKSQDSQDSIITLCDTIGLLDVYDIEINLLLDKLTKQEREVIKLMIEGYSNSEIAKILNTSYTSVTSSLSKGRKTLKKLYYK